MKTARPLYLEQCILLKRKRDREENRKKQVRSDNDASELDILGHFGTFRDILDIFGQFGRLLDELGLSS